MEENEAKKEQKVEEEQGEKKQEKVEEVEEDESIALELRNTDSVFSELSELSHDYVESVDQGASVRGKLIMKQGSDTSLHPHRS